jgi:hypothetical protein
MTDRNDVHRWFLTAALCLAAVGCATPGAPDGTGGQPGESSADNGAGAGDGGSSGGGGSGGSADGPITATMESGTYGYPVGRCEIVDDVVYVTALAENQTGAFEATLPAWDREIAYAQRSGRVSLTNFGSSDGDTFELVAGRGDPGTTWEWTVSGSSVEVVARMANRTTAPREDGVERFTEYRDVTIDIECGGGVFGSGPNAERYAQQEFPIVEDPMQRVPGRVSVELEETTFEIAFLTTCQFFQDQVSAEGIANEANVWLYSEGAGVHLNFEVGDQRDDWTPEGVERWALPPDVQFQDDFLFEGSDTTRTWNGQVVAEDGTEADATITVECTEGDAFDSAGTASIVLDGVTHDLDVVSTCAIDGSIIDFFGQSSESDVAVVVTGGGSEILLADEEGQQTMTRDIVFAIAGQQATWTGSLAGNRQATVSIGCG